jgi:Zn-dependent peptidase ImmA (M78 family)/transcriptional regulator with XRE-family HTH domain
MRQGTPGFVGARLRQGREARGISAASLAEVVGVTRAAMSQYEHGHQSPSPETMQRISVALNLPVRRFLLPMVPRESAPRFYRCMAAATKSARTRAESRYEWLKEIVAHIQQHVRMPIVRLPKFDLPADLAKLGGDEIDELADDARRFFGLKDGPISNVVWLLENHGCIVSCVDLHADTLDAFSEVDPRGNRPYVVLGTHKRSAARSRFDACHELGHILLHRSVTASMLTQPDVFTLIESQAHRFANAFLLPSSSFTRECKEVTLDGLRSLKERWRVSVAAMIRRARDLRVIGEQQYRALQINLGRRKWKTREPLDDILEMERPRFLKTCFELLVSKGIVPAIDAPMMLGLPAKDIEDLAALAPGYLHHADSRVLLSGEEETDDNAGMILRFPKKA